MPHTRTGRLIGIPRSPFIMCHPVRNAADFKTSQTIRGMDVSLQHRLRRLQEIAIGTKGGEPAKSKLHI
jgi:hypothetical protein